MTPSPRIPGRRAFALLVGLALSLAAAACSAPKYDAQIDDQITATQTLANALIERLIGLDEERRLLPAQPRSQEERALLAQTQEEASYRANRPAYEEVRTQLISLRTRMGARGSASTPEILNTVAELRNILVAPPAGPGAPATSMQARHAASGRLSAAFLTSPRPRRTRCSRPC
jgi:hypothetical protein